jgi:hypothetical protein
VRKSFRFGRLAINAGRSEAAGKFSKLRAFARFTAAKSQPIAMTVLGTSGAIGSPDAIVHKLRAGNGPVLARLID